MDEVKVRLYEMTRSATQSEDHIYVIK